MHYHDKYHIKALKNRICLNTFLQKIVCGPYKNAYFNVIGNIFLISKYNIYKAITPIVFYH